MKKQLKLSLILIFFLSISSQFFAQIKIGNNPASINATSLLELESTTKGVLFPRMNTVQMNTIANINGMVVYNTDTNCLVVYNNSYWRSLCDSMTDDNQSLTKNLDTVFLSNGGFIVMFDQDSTNELQSITKTTDTIYLSNGGGFVVLSDQDSTNELQNIRMSNDTIYLNNGGYVVIIDNDVTNELQTLSKSNDTIYLSNGGFVIDKNDGIPVGATFSFPMATAPTGYLACDGSAVSRTTYASLFALLGITYGNGNGTTTFNLPDYRGRFLRGQNNGAGRDPNTATRTDRGDGTTGDNIGTIQADENKNHLHAVDPPAINTNTTGNHTHARGTLNGIAQIGGSHQHAYTRTTSLQPSGSHNHSFNTIPSSTNSINAGHRHTYLGLRAITRSSGFYSHTHNFTTRTLNTNTINQLHSHTYFRPTSINNTANHSHNLNFTNFSTSLVGNHQHIIRLTGSIATNGNHLHSVNIPNFNSANSGTNESRPKNIYVLWCIKY